MPWARRIRLQYPSDFAAFSKVSSEKPFATKGKVNARSRRARGCRCAPILAASHNFLRSGRRRCRRARRRGEPGPGGGQGSTGSPAAVSPGRQRPPAWGCQVGGTGSAAAGEREGKKQGGGREGGEGRGGETEGGREGSLILPRSRSEVLFCFRACD